MRRQLTRIAALAAAGLLASATVACGGDDTEEQTVEDNDASNDQESAPDDGHLLLDTQPPRHAYEVGGSLRPVATVYDAEWNEIDDEYVDLQWSASPSELASRDGQNWDLVRAGIVTFEACAELSAPAPDDADNDAENQSAGADSTTICDSIDVPIVDDQNRVVIDSPQPGEHFDGAEDSTIPVSGSVGDEIDVDSVQVNGQTVDVDSSGQFSHELSPRFGVNAVTVRAFDGVNADDHTAFVSALWAPAYREPVVDDDGIHTSFDDALLLTLGQNFLDNGEPYTEISESEIITEDLADILALVLENLDITSEIPNPVVDTDALVLSVPDIIVDDPHVELLATDDGVELFAQLTDTTIETDGFISLTDETVSLEGDLQATVSLYATLDIEKAGTDSDFDVEMNDFELALEDATPNFDADEANAIFELADSALRDNIEEIIFDSVDLSFIDTLPDLVLDMLDSLDEVMADQEFELDLDFGEPVTISFDGQPGQFTPVRGSGLEGHIVADIGLDAEPIHDDKPGIPLLQPEMSQSPMFDNSNLQIGLDLAVLNGVFHSLWNAGFLDLDITELVPESFQNIINDGHAEGMLPPVMRPPTDDEQFDAILELGQLELELDWMDQADRFGVDVEVGVDLEVIGEEIAIDMADEPDIRVWLIESTDDDPVLTTEDIRELISSILWSDIEDAVADNLAFALPMPELDVLEPYAPALADMALTVRMNRSPDIRQGYLMLDAGLEGEHLLD